MDELTLLDGIQHYERNKYQPQFCVCSKMSLIRPEVTFFDQNCKKKKKRKKAFHHYFFLEHVLSFVFFFDVKSTFSPMLRRVFFLKVIESCVGSQSCVVFFGYPVRRFFFPCFLCNFQ